MEGQTLRVAAAASGILVSQRSVSDKHADTR
jgi:hypothetical protein